MKDNKNQSDSDLLQISLSFHLKSLITNRDDQLNIRVIEDDSIRVSFRECWALLSSLSHRSLSYMFRKRRKKLERELKCIHLAYINLSITNAHVIPFVHAIHRFSRSMLQSNHQLHLLEQNFDHNLNQMNNALSPLLFVRKLLMDRILRRMLTRWRFKFIRFVILPSSLSTKYGYAAPVHYLKMKSITVMRLLVFCKRLHDIWSRIQILNCANYRSPVRTLVWDAFSMWKECITSSVEKQFDSVLEELVYFKCIRYLETVLIQILFQYDISDFSGSLFLVYVHACNREVNMCTKHSRQLRDLLSVKIDSISDVIDCLVPAPDQEISLSSSNTRDEKIEYEKTTKKETSQYTGKFLLNIRSSLIAHSNNLEHREKRIQINMKNIFYSVSTLANITYQQILNNMHDHMLLFYSRYEQPPGFGLHFQLVNYIQNCIDNTKDDTFEHWCLHTCGIALKSRHLRSLWSKIAGESRQLRGYRWSQIRQCALFYATRSLITVRIIHMLASNTIIYDLLSLMKQELEWVLMLHKQKLDFGALKTTISNYIDNTTEKGIRELAIKCLTNDLAIVAFIEFEFDMDRVDSMLVKSVLNPCRDITEQMQRFDPRVSRLNASASNFMQHLEMIFNSAGFVAHFGERYAAELETKFNTSNSRIYFIRNELEKNHQLVRTRDEIVLKFQRTVRQAMAELVGIIHIGGHSRKRSLVLRGLCSIVQSMQMIQRNRSDTKD